MTWVQISKVIPQPKSIPPGKGGKPYGKTSKCPNLSVKNMVQAKFFKFMFCTSVKFPVN